MRPPKLDTYLDLCTQFYNLDKPEAPEDAYAFYKSYAIEAQGPILEPMCGTGRFLLPLLTEGFDVHGFDASDSMLNTLQEQAKSKNLKPYVWPGFVEDLNRKERYKLIFIPCGSFGLISDLADAAAALKTFYNHLADDGVFVFEAETLKGVPSQLGVWRGRTAHRADGKRIVLSNLAEMKGDICHSICKYELIDENKIINTEVEELKIRVYDNAFDLIIMLKQAGFQDIKILKAFDRSKDPDEPDAVIIYECRK